MPEGTVKQTALEKCLGCARAASSHILKARLQRLLRSIAPTLSSKLPLSSASKIMVKGSVTNYIKPFREQEVSKAVIYGRRLESAFDFEAESPTRREPFVFWQDPRDVYKHCEDKQKEMT